MNFFRSEEHARRSPDFTKEADAGLLHVADLMTIFSAAPFRERRRGRYITRRPALRAELLTVVKTVTRDDEFWRPVMA